MLYCSSGEVRDVSILKLYTYANNLNNGTYAASRNHLYRRFTDYVFDLICLIPIFCICPKFIKLFVIVFYF